MVERRILLTVLVSLLPYYASASENDVGAFQTGSYRKPYVRTYGLTHTQCHNDCAYRHRCSAYTYKRQFKRCDWFPLEITMVPLSTREVGVVLQEMTTEVRQVSYQQRGRFICQIQGKNVKTSYYAYIKFSFILFRRNNVFIWETRYTTSNYPLL